VVCNGNDDIVLSESKQSTWLSYLEIEEGRGLFFSLVKR